jgi:hypothetical protein
MDPISGVSIDTFQHPKLDISGSPIFDRHYTRRSSDRGSGYYAPAPGGGYENKPVFPAGAPQADVINVARLKDRSSTWRLHRAHL